jgi:hypothetical protein
MQVARPAEAGTTRGRGARPAARFALHSRSRWPECPHPKHRTEPWQSATKWSSAKHRKQRPKVLRLKEMDSPDSFLGGEAGPFSFSDLERRRLPTSSHTCATSPGAPEAAGGAPGAAAQGSSAGGGGGRAWPSGSDESAGEAPKTATSAATTAGAALARAAGVAGAGSAGP